MDQNPHLQTVLVHPCPTLQSILISYHRELLLRQHPRVHLQSVEFRSIRGIAYISAEERVVVLAWKEILFPFDFEGHQTPTSQDNEPRSVLLALACNPSLADAGEEKKPT